MCCAIKEGRVSVTMVNCAEGTNKLYWDAVVDISGGMDVHARFAAGETVQLFAVCYGWINRTINEDEIKSYTTEHNFALHNFRFESWVPQAGQLLPRSAKLSGDVTDITVPMEQTVLCEVRVVDQQGKPLADAVVSMWPNQVVLNSGSSFMGAFGSSLMSCQTGVRRSRKVRPSAVRSKSVQSENPR